MTRTRDSAGRGRPVGGPRPVDALVAEIGSTTTVVSAFDGLREYPAATPCLVGQGVAATSVADGDVTIGVNAARAQLEAALGAARARAHAGDQLGGRRPAHDRPRPHAAHDGHGGARGRAGGRRGRQVPDRRPPARPRPARDRGRAGPTSSCSPAGWRAATATPCSSTPSASRSSRRGPSSSTPATPSSAATRRSCWSGPASGSSSPTTSIRPSTSSTSCRPGTSSTTPSRSTSRTRPAWSASARS